MGRANLRCSKQRRVREFARRTKNDASHGSTQQLMQSISKRPVLYVRRALASLERIIGSFYNKPFYV